jgi:hypothetical protein
MEKEQAIFILDALAAGSSPESGEVLKGHTVLHMPRIVEALEEGALALRIMNRQNNHPPVKLEDKDVIEIMEFFYQIEYNPTPHRLAQFLMGSRAIKLPDLQHHVSFGVKKRYCSYGQLKNYFVVFFEKHSKLVDKYYVDEEAWKQVLYFQKQSFNQLTKTEMKKLKDSIRKMPIIKKDRLSPELVEIRERFPRSHEPWSTDEKNLLAKAIIKTNDLIFLSTCFQRGKNALEISGQKLIHSGQVSFEEQEKSAA